jgi:hypothetical protein
VKSQFVSAFGAEQAAGRGGSVAAFLGAVNLLVALAGAWANESWSLAAAGVVIAATWALAAWRVSRMSRFWSTAALAGVAFNVHQLWPVLGTVPHAGWFLRILALALLKCSATAVSAAFEYPRLKAAEQH